MIVWFFLFLFVWKSRFLWNHGGAAAWAQNFGWVGHIAFGPPNNWPVSL